MWADAYVSLSRADTDEELEDAGFNKGKIIHIPNGVDTSVFYPIGSLREKTRLREKLTLPDKKIVAFIGRLDPQKRADLLIEIFNELGKVREDSHLVIIGGGPEKEKIESMLNKNIAFAGTVDNVNDYLRASDLFVLPSLAEGMSNVILEAMATGLPVISTKISSNQEIIDNGTSGILLDIEDRAGLKENIIRILGDSAFGDKLGQNARSRIVENFSIETVAAKYIELFEQLLGRVKK